MTRSIALLGSTGSIGRQTLEVVRELGVAVAALTANSSVDLIERQAREFSPRLVALYDEAAARELKARLSDTGIEVLSGMDGLLAAATAEEADTVVTAVVGMIGLKPTLAAISKGKRIALANKETLVCAGELVMDAAARTGAEIIPVDSEHSAIFQCLQGCRDRFDLALLDPPYQNGLLEAVLPLLAGKMQPGGVIVCESEKNEQLPQQAGEYRIWREYRYGKAKLTVYRVPQEA